MSADLRDDCYVRLGVGPTATDPEIREAWERLTALWHPDRVGPVGRNMVAALEAAYAVLSEPQRRAAYDKRHGYAALRSTNAETRARRAPGVMLSRLTGPLDALLASGVARRLDEGTIELVLEREEAAQGGMVTVAMRVPVRCGACDGTTGVECERCGAKRTVDEVFSAWLAVPPGVADGMAIAPSAQLPGVVRPIGFRLRVRE